MVTAPAEGSTEWTTGSVQVAADQQVDVAVQGGGEQHALPLGPDLVEQFGDLGHEAHVGHLVGLVQHGDGDLVQAAVAALDEVLEPSRGGDDDFAPPRSALACRPIDMPPTTVAIRSLSDRA